MDYTNNLCFVQSTYYIPMKVPLGADEAPRIRAENEITYYQWIPLFFMCLGERGKIMRKLRYKTQFHQKTQRSDHTLKKTTRKRIRVVFFEFFFQNRVIFLCLA